MKASKLRPIFKVICTFFMGFILYTSSAQEQSSNFWSHVRFGGGLGLSFGNEFFSATVAPSGIYEFNEQFALGLGANFTYNRQKNFYKTTIVGGSIIGLYNIIPQLQVSTEFEQLNVTRTFESDLLIPDDNYWYPALFLGAGFRNGNFTIGIRYDVLYDDEKSIYANAWMPFVRIYF